MTRLAASSLAVAIAAALMAPAHAAERPTLAVVPFTGPQATRAEAVVVRALRKKAQLIPPTLWNKSANKLFAHTHSPEDIQAVAEDVGAKIVITGVVKRDGRAWQLSVSVRDGADGKSRARLKYPLKTPRIPPPTLALLAKEIAESFDSVLNGEGTVEEGGPPPGRSGEKPAGKKPTVAETTPPATETTPPATTNPPASAPAKEEELAPVKANVEAQKPAPPSRRPRWAPYFDVNAGGSMTGRHFDFAAGPPHFSSAVVGGIFADLTVYPLAFTWNKAAGVFSGLGLGATVDKPFWADSTSNMVPNAHFATTELKVEGGLRWRIVLYKSIPRPELLLQGGGGLHTFSIAKDMTGMDAGPPDVAYKYLDFGGGFRLHFAEWAYLTALFNYHLVLASGPISDVGSEYGPVATYGLKFGGGLDFLLWRGLKLSVSGFYERFTLTFVPGTTMPAKQATGAVDQYYGGIVSVGYVL